MSLRSERIEKAIIERPYIFYFVALFLMYIIISVFVNQSYITFKTLFSAYRADFYVPFILLNFTVAFLTALNINLIIIKFREISFMTSGEEGITFAGVFSGLLGGACPGCFAGLFPAFLGLFGVSLTLSNLPFYGLEILMASILLLVVSTLLLTRESVCKINIKTKKNSKIKRKR